MSDMPRKLIAVKKEPPSNGYRFMAEIGNRTYTFQTDDAFGEEVIGKLNSLLFQCMMSGFKSGVVRKGSGAMGQSEG
jgi:hypothetical protein